MLYWLIFCPDKERAGKTIILFEKIERIYYYEHYADHVQAQNERNEKNRHTERNRTVDDLLTNNKTCPEESIYQIGTVEESVPGKLLAKIAVEFFAEMEENSAPMSTYWTGRCTLTKAPRISMKDTFLTVKINTANYVRSRRKRWKNWGATP